MSSVPVLLSRKWSSTSKWGSEELLLLNVDNEKCPGTELLNAEWRSYEDTTLANLLKSVPCDVSEFDDMFGSGHDCLKDTAEFSSRYNTELGMFYECMSEVVVSTNSRKEMDSYLNVRIEDLLDFIHHKGSAKPLSSGSESSTKSTGAGAGSPLLSRTVRFETDEQINSTDRAPAMTGLSIPKSSSMKSIQSNLSDEMGTAEAQTEIALHCLLHVVVANMSKLRIVTTHTRFRIEFGGVEGPTCINDGQVAMKRRLQRSNLVPLINVECKSRAGSSGPDILSKIYAQEFGECLAIVQKRARLSTFVLTRPPELFTVYSIGAHGRRAYLLRTDFSTEYLNGINEGDLKEHRVLVRRSEANYRLDKKDELRQFVALIYRLCMQLDAQIPMNF